MKGGKWSVSPFSLVVAIIFVVGAAGVIFGHGKWAAIGGFLALAVLLVSVVDLLTGGATPLPRRFRRPIGARQSYGYGTVGVGSGAPDDGSGAQYIAQADTPSDEAWQRERARYEDKQARRGDT